MNKNTVKIKDGIRRLTHKPFEIISGTVIAGSVDNVSCTMSVMPSDSLDPIDGVLLNVITNNGNGLILFPADGSNVIIGSVDGPGQWALLQANEIEKAKIKIGDVALEMNSAQVKILNNRVEFNMSDTVFKFNSASESLFQLLKDCFTYITELTVPTPSGTSSIPVNVADFNNLLTRLNNLLAA